MSDKKERLLTPIGFAKWAHVHTPRAAFDEKEKPKYQIDVCFSSTDPAWIVFAKDIMARLAELPAKIDRATGEKVKHRSPIKRELNKDDSPTGRHCVSFKTGEQFKPNVFDKYGKPLPESDLIGNESKVRVSYTPAPYEGFGGGVTLYLNAVQVLELVPYQKQTAAAYGFESEASPPEQEAPPERDPFGDDSMERMR